MASFNEWLNRRDEAFHQDRFDRAMDKMAGKELFDKYAQLENVAKQLEDVVGQVTRLKGGTQEAEELMKDVYNAANRSDLTDKDALSKTVEELSNIVKYIQTAQKGMPNRDVGTYVNGIQKHIQIMRSRLDRAKHELMKNYDRGHGADITGAPANFLRAAEFKRSGFFSPEKYGHDPV
jgi:predicted  nucleic acid-binding Zn-ribbon protein